METNPTRVCELIVGLPAVRVLGVDEVAGEPLAVHVETRGPRPVCPVRARNSVVAGHAAFRYSLMSLSHRVDLTVCRDGGGTPAVASRFGLGRRWLRDRCGRCWL